MKSPLYWWRYQSRNIYSCVSVLVGSEGKNDVWGRGEWQLKFCAHCTRRLTMPCLPYPFPHLLWKMWGGVKIFRRFRSDSARRSRSTFMERVAAGLFAHAAVGVLSQNILMWQCLRSVMTVSRTIHPRSSPVSSGSELVMYPFILFSETKRLRTSTGNRTDHAIWDKWCVPLVHTHPAPSYDAFMKPTYWGFPGMISYTLFGFW